MSERFSFLKSVSEGVIVLVHVVPGAKKTEIQGLFGEPARLKLRIEAPPVEGAANAAVVKFFNHLFGVRHVQLLRGEKSRKKDILVPGLDVISAQNKIQQVLHE